LKPGFIPDFSISNTCCTSVYSPLRLQATTW